MSSSNTLLSDSTSIDSGVDDLQNPKFDYTGNFNEQGFRDRYGCQTWNRPFRHKYAGFFLYNNMHDKGFYFIKQEEGTSFYDGQFYNNKLEGYGQVIHKDGKVYEGLFKGNRKFGPGVLSYPDGTQDVGLWNGNYLIRLSLSVSSDIVPSLCNNAVSKIKVLRFKKIVPALPKKKDIAKDLMCGLTEDERFSQSYPELYNPHVRNEHSLFFDRRLYDLAQLGSEDSIIEVLEDEAFVDGISEVTDSEDAISPCSNERFIHITKQIDELQSDMLKIHDMKTKYQKQLQKCKICCDLITTSPSGNMPESSSVTSRTKTETDRNTRLPSEASIPEGVNLFSKQEEEKNLEQDISNVQTSDDGGDGYINQDAEKTQENFNRKNEESINKIFMCTKDFRSEQSMNNSGQEAFLNAFGKPNCTCIDEEIPDVDLLIEELGKLQREEKFYQKVLDLLNRVLFMEFSTVKKLDTSKIVKLQVEDLLTWNNGKTAIEILQHSFRYRNFENILSFKIKSLFIGDRAAFGKVGSQEAICINFLKHCVLNELYEVRKDLFHHNVYPDLADARGNTGLHLAVTGDCHGIIRQLANSGANLDAFNDECLTPLLLSILRYIATLNRVVFWDRAFLSETVLNTSELDQVTQWRPHESLVSLREFIGPSSQLLQKQQFSKGEVRKETEDISTKIRSRLFSSRTSSLAMKMNLDYVFSTAFISDYEKFKKALASKKIEDLKAKDAEPIAQTIGLLLHYGADPNIGELPMKPILLSVFTKNSNLVENLLKHNANPESTSEENLTALHILSTLPFGAENVQIAEKLLKYSSDPNRKCGNDFWLDQNEELIGAYLSPVSENEDYDGKTPLQMIAMRKDFDEENVNYQCDLVRVLIEYGALYDQYYLGHTLLSLAVLRGNRKLIETLHRFVELGQPLGENMGNALTMLGLCRFPFIRSFVHCKNTIDDLIAFGMNPFNPIYDFSNIFEFFLYEYSHDVDFDIPRVRANIEAEDASLRRVLYSNSSETYKNCNKLSVAYMKEIGRNILMKLYQYKSLQILLRFAEEDLLYHKCLENMARFFTISEALDCLKLFIKQNKIKIDSDYQEIILKVLNFISVNNCKTIKKTSQKYVPLPSAFPLVLEDEIAKLKNNFEVPNYIAMYALDTNPEKYEVCFHCMRKSDKKLLCCPCCGSVKFCSDMCNKYSNKSDTKHNCDNFFYNETRIYTGKPNENMQLTGIDLLMQEAKQTRDEERLAELMKRQAEEEEKLKKQLRKSQKLDSQLSLHEKKSQSKSASVSFIKDSESKKKICCKKSSSIFVCDEKEQLQPKKLNCGFHCGQVIPDVHLDNEGNVVREQEFCECYPLYKKEVESMKSKAEEDQVVTTTQTNDEKISEQYSLSEIYGGVLSEERAVKDPKELDTLMESIAKDEKRKSIISDGMMSNIDTEKNTEQESEAQKQNQDEILGDATDTDDDKKKYPDGEQEEYDERSATDGDSKKSDEINVDKFGKKGAKKKKKKKIQSESPSGDEEEKKKKSRKIKSSPSSTKKKKEKNIEKMQSDGESGHEKEEEKKGKSKGRKSSPKPSKKKKGKNTEKVQSDSASTNKKEEEKKKKGERRKLSPTSNKQKKSKPESENASKRRKKSSKKETQLEGKSITDGKKTKKKEKEDKSIEASSRHDKKTMTKSGKNKRKIRGQEAGVQVDIKHKSEKSSKSSKKSTSPSRKKKGDRKQRDESIDRKRGRTEGKEEKGSGRKMRTDKGKSKERKIKVSEKKKMKGSKMKGSMELKTKESGKRGKTPKVKDKKVKSTESDERYEEISPKDRRKEKLYPIKSRKDEKSKSILLEHADKTRRDVLIGKTLASMRALDAKLLHPEKILALSGSSYKEFQRISKVYQYFLELIAKYFPDFDLSCLMLPFACFLDGQLYYKFADALPYYCRTYSAV